MHCVADKPHNQLPGLQDAVMGLKGMTIPRALVIRTRSFETYDRCGCNEMFR